MTPSEALLQHRQICDELYQLALEENRFMQEHRRPADAVILEKKRALSARMDIALEALRASPSGSARDPEMKAALEKARERVMQIMQLDRENEQLLTRFSLGTTAPAPAAPAQPGMLKKIYSRKS
jgi:hypothetical protein